MGKEHDLSLSSPFSGGIKFLRGWKSNFATLLKIFRPVFLELRVIGPKYKNESSSVCLTMY